MLVIVINCMYVASSDNQQLLNVYSDTDEHILLCVYVHMMD